MGAALGYIRRSRVFADRPGAVSHEAQTTAIRALAAQHGYPELVILEDWGRSGGAGKEGKRTGYRDLRAAVKAGTCSDVFAYDQSRLTRSTIEWANLVEACREQHVKVHLVNGGTKDFDSVDGRMTADILATVAQAERERGQERGAATVAFRRKRGDRLGPPPFGWRADGRDGREGVLVPAEGEDVRAVVDAFRATGSYQRTAKLLNERGVPSKRADRPDPRTGLPSIWRATAIRRIIGREAPELVLPGGREGSRSRQDYRLAGLLRCSCGATLTPFLRIGHKDVSYRCQRSWTAADHPRPASVPETRLLPWIKAEVAHLRLPVDAVQMGAEHAQTRQALETERDGLAMLFARKSIDLPTFDRLVAPVDDALAELVDTEAVAAVSPIRPEEWDGTHGWTPQDINAYLRGLLEYVKLDATMQPLPWPDGPKWRNRDLRGT